MVTTPVTLDAETPLEAWQAGVTQLLNQGDSYNVITHIRRPLDFNLQGIKRINPRALSPKFPSTSDVINTIFPMKLWKGDRADFYRDFLERNKRARGIHPRIKTRWGTYFERMINFGDSHQNQLEDCILAINSWERNHCAALVIHTSSCEVDSIRKIVGNPCLQYLEFICPTDNTVALSVVYRNHDYFGKVLGNFVGLAFLLNFIASQTARTPDTLTCFAAHAYHESTKSNLRTLAGR